MVERNVDGIAVMTSEMQEDALTQIPRRIPVILMNQPSLQDRYANVPVEYGNSFHEAVEYLRSLHHRDIGFIAGPPDLSSAKRRRRDWELAMKDLKLRVRPEWIVTGDMRVESGEVSMKSLLALRRRPTAVLATNDLMGVGALQAAHHAGVRVPKELSLIGFDDLPVSSMMVPPLTSIRIPRREIASHAFDYLLRAIRGEKPLPCPPVYPKLVIRKSTGAALRTSP
jgi:DNA-binding LacI/PurR family transcriptional regulator